MATASRILRFQAGMTRKKKTIGPIDPREVPMYTIAEASFYIGVPESTLDAWTYGRDYKAKGEIRHSPRLITPADARRGLLSFAKSRQALSERRKGPRLDSCRGCAWLADHQLRQADQELARRRWFG